MSRTTRNELRRSRARIGRNITVALRAERVIARRRLAVMRTQTGLMAFAGVVAGMGLVMVNVGLFFWVSGRFGEVTAGFVLGAVNFGVAVLLVLAAGRMTAEPELEPMIELRDMALEDVEAEVEHKLDELGDIAVGLRQITRDPLGALGAGLVAPLVTVLLKSLRK